MSRMRIIKETWDKLPINLKRYLIDASDVFLAGFLPSLALGIGVLQTNPEMAFKSVFWVSLVTGAFTAGIKAIIKLSREYKTGYFQKVRDSLK